MALGETDVTDLGRPMQHTDEAGVTHDLEIDVVSEGGRRWIEVKNKAPFGTGSTDWTDPALDSGDMQTVTPTKTFTATGTWTAATQLVLATVGTGTAGLFIAWAALSATRTLVNGDTLDVTLAVKLA